MRTLLSSLVALLLAMGSTQPAIAADTIYVMRHLQKAEGADPPLSAEGTANARALVDRLAASNVKAIFATPTLRAMQTGQQLAKKLGIAITSYDPRDPDALVKDVAAVPGAVLIVGHSNTVPDLVERLGGRPAIKMTEQDYGTVYVLHQGSSDVTAIALERAH